MNVLLVQRPGLLTTVQDGGRWGWQHLGVPVSGWMDSWSARLANRLVGNQDGAALLEITWVGPTLRLQGPAAIAATGAEFDVTVGGVTHRSPLVLNVAGDVAIAFGARHRGTRAYFAVSGGVATSPVLGSRATDLRSRIGGIAGRRLLAGDRVPLGVAGRPVAPPAIVSTPWLHERLLRVTPTPAGASAGTELYEQTYRLADASDRTGYRLEGVRPLPLTTGSLPSQPVVMGAVQAPPGGAPVLLMADRQTTGGYAVVGVVSAADLPMAGQLGPGDTCRFVPCSPDDSRAAIADRERTLDAMAERVR